MRSRHAQTMQMTPRLFRAFTLLLDAERRATTPLTLGSFTALFPSARVKVEGLILRGYAEITPDGVLRTTRDAAGREREVA